MLEPEHDNKINQRSEKGEGSEETDKTHEALSMFFRKSVFCQIYLASSLQKNRLREKQEQS